MKIAMRFLALVLAALVRLYQLTLSSVTPAHCRYLPSCSAYAHEALLTHGPLTGGWLALRRLLRCHPWGGSGYDPVPPRPGPRTKATGGACNDACLHRQ
ncbi:MAG: membrane protein insertion efficiency factor YidD [Kiloniellales bacterium]